MHLYADGREVIYQFNLTLNRRSCASSLSAEIHKALTLQQRELARVMSRLRPQGKKDTQRSDLIDIDAVIEKGLLTILEPSIGWPNVLKSAVMVENQRIVPLRITIAPPLVPSPPPNQVTKGNVVIQTTGTSPTEPTLSRVTSSASTVVPTATEPPPSSQCVENNTVSEQQQPDVVASYAQEPAFDNAALNESYNYASESGPHDMYGQSMYCDSDAFMNDGGSGAQTYNLMNPANVSTGDMPMYCDPTYNQLYPGMSAAPFAMNNNSMYLPNGAPSSSTGMDGNSQGVVGAFMNGPTQQQLAAIYGLIPHGSSNYGNTSHRRSNTSRQQNHRLMEPLPNRPYSAPTEYRIDYRSHAELLPAMPCTHPPFTEIDMGALQHQTLPREHVPYIFCSVAPVCRPEPIEEHLKSPVPLPLFAYPGESSCAMCVSHFTLPLAQMRTHRLPPQLLRPPKKNREYPVQNDQASWVHAETLEELPYPPIPWQLAENPIYPMHVFILQLIAARSPIIPCIPLRCRALATLDYKRPEDYHNMVDKCAMGRLRQEFFNSCAHLALKLAAPAFPGVPGRITVYQYYSMFIWCLTQGGANKAEGDSAFWGACVRAIFPQPLPPLELEAAAGALRRLYNWTLSKAESMVEPCIRMELCQEELREVLHEKLKSSPTSARPKQSNSVNPSTAPSNPNPQGANVQWPVEEQLFTEFSSFWNGFENECPAGASQQGTTSNGSAQWECGVLPPTFHSTRHTDASVSEAEVLRYMWDDNSIALSIRDEAEAPVIDVAIMKAETGFMKNVHIAIVLLRAYGRLKLMNEAALRASHAKAQKEIVPVFDLGIDQECQRDFLVKPELIDMVAYYRFVTTSALRYIEEPTNPKGPNVLELDEDSFVNIGRHCLRMQQSRNPLMYLPTGEPPQITHWPPPPKLNMSKKSWEDYPAAQLYAALHPQPRPPTGPSPFVPHPFMQHGYLAAAAAQFCHQSSQQQAYHQTAQYYPNVARPQTTQPPRSSAPRRRPSIEESMQSLYVPCKYEGNTTMHRSIPVPPRRSDPSSKDSSKTPSDPKEPIAVRPNPAQRPIDHTVPSESSQTTAVHTESSTDASSMEVPEAGEQLPQGSSNGEEVQEEAAQPTRGTPRLMRRLSPKKDRPVPVPVPKDSIHTAFVYVRSSRNGHKVRPFRVGKVSGRSQQRKRTQKPVPAPVKGLDKAARMVQRFVRTWNRAGATTLHRHPAETLLTVVQLNQMRREKNRELLTSDEDEISFCLFKGGATIVPSRSFLTYCKKGLGAIVPKATLDIANARKRGGNRIPAPVSTSGPTSKVIRLQAGGRMPPARPSTLPTIAETPEEAAASLQGNPKAAVLPLVLADSEALPAETSGRGQRRSQQQPQRRQQQTKQAQPLAQPRRLPQPPPTLRQPAQPHAVPLVSQTGPPILRKVPSGITAVPEPLVKAVAKAVGRRSVDAISPPTARVVARGQKRTVPPARDDSNTTSGRRSTGGHERSVKRSRMKENDSSVPVSRAKGQNSLTAAAALVPTPPRAPPTPEPQMPSPPPPQAQKPGLVQPAPEPLQQQLPPPPQQFQQPDHHPVPPHQVPPSRQVPHPTPQQAHFQLPAPQVQQPQPYRAQVPHHFTPAPSPMMEMPNTAGRQTHRLSSQMIQTPRRISVTGSAARGGVPLPGHPGHMYGSGRRVSTYDMEESPRYYVPSDQVEDDYSMQEQYHVQPPRQHSYGGAPPPSMQYPGPHAVRYEGEYYEMPPTAWNGYPVGSEPGADHHGGGWNGYPQPPSGLQGERSRDGSRWVMVGGDSSNGTPLQIFPPGYGRQTSDLYHQGIPPPGASVRPRDTYIVGNHHNRNGATESRMWTQTPSRPAMGRPLTSMGTPDRY